MASSLGRIAAIETLYKGYRFRSRLKARWAVFFDQLGIKYLYEPDGFEKKIDDEDVIRYLPDFYLPDSGTWVEVKGLITASDATKLGQFLDFGCPLPLFDGSDGAPDIALLNQHGIAQYKECRGLLLLGEIPSPQHGYHFHPIIRHRKGLSRTWVSFGSKHWIFEPHDQWLKGVHAATGNRLPTDKEFMDGYAHSDEEALAFFNPSSSFLPTALAFRYVIDAYRAARSARFEHGETGAAA